MTRVQNWETKLAKSIESMRNKQFAYGSFDCCRAAATVIESITGTDLMQGLEYCSEDEAQSVIRSLGDDFCAAVSSIAEQHGLEPRSPEFASRGDLVVVDLNGQQIAGVIGTDARYAVCATHKGIKQVERNNIIRAWRV